MSFSHSITTSGSLRALGELRRVVHPRPPWIPVPAALLLAAAVGCGGGAHGAQSPAGVTDAQGSAQAAPWGIAPTGSTSTDDASMAELRDHHLHHHGGFPMFVAMSLRFLNATPEQSKAIARIEAEMNAELRPTQDAEGAVLVALAQGVAAGNVDREKLDAAIGRVTTAAAAAHAAFTGSLVRLHDVLTPEQRTALVQKVDANFSVWKDVNAAEAPLYDSANADGGRLARLTQALDLSPDQTAQIRASLKAWRDRVILRFDREATGDYLGVFDKAFAGDVFDARALDTGAAANANMSAWGMATMASFYEAALPSLTPDQRTRLADALRWHASNERIPYGT